MVIRFSLVQLRTPDAMRGRVGAVNFLFINASNQLGQFESGVTAALFGAVPAAVLGGVGDDRDRAVVDEAVSDAARGRSGWSRALHARYAGGRASRHQPMTVGTAPRPTNGILVAITVMNSTLASSGRLAM